MQLDINVNAQNVASATEFPIRLVQANGRCHVADCEEKRGRGGGGSACRTDPSTQIQQDSFGSGALLEDYVELIADLLTTSGEARPTDVARRLGVSHVIDVTTVDD
jgi:hypothetical protein